MADASRTRRQQTAKSAVAPAPAGPSATPAPVFTLVAAVLGFFIISLDVTAANVALPAIGHELDGRMTDLQWIVDGYTLPFAALLLSAGACSDRIGAGRAYAMGLTLFVLASAGCGLAPQLGWLIAARVAQGVAAAIMMPSALSLIRQAYTDAKARMRAISVWTAGASVAIATGPVVGGALTSGASWRLIFFVNLPLGLLVLALLTRAHRAVPRRTPLDVPGQVIATAVLASLTYAVIEGGRGGGASPAVLGAALVCCTGAAGFVAVERRAAQPLLPLGFFRSRAVSACVAAGFAVNVAIYGTIFVVSLFLQTVRGLSAIDAGTVFLPMTTFLTAASLLASPFTIRCGQRLPALVGQLSLVVGLLSLLWASFHAGTAPLALAMIPLGIGGGLAAPPLTAALLNSVAEERSGMAAGVFNASRQVGGAISVAVFGSVLAGADSFPHGMRICLVIGAVVVAATCTASFRYLKERS
ncbi:MFS transporter [Streptomyces sp. NPDC048650]|uniref:MFS transporter n=1 Tax=unclassified Streptomyces TaxID=2593676 RepID=UPI0037111D25